MKSAVLSTVRKYCESCLPLRIHSHSMVSATVDCDQDTGLHTGLENHTQGLLALVDKVESRSTHSQAHTAAASRTDLQSCRSQAHTAVTSRTSRLSEADTSQEQSWVWWALACTWGCSWEEIHTDQVQKGSSDKMVRGSTGVRIGQALRKERRIS